ncbi:RWD domain-containing protein [Rutstroemia sp. NJR-2017a BVV2]|nr:RWD domain-containing protein [Rutstroemia sp. NJR-2017a BVV2]
MLMLAFAMEDQRQEELDCVAAIFPEIEIDAANPFCASIALSVSPQKPVTVAFPAASDGTQDIRLITPPQSASSGEEGQARINTENAIESHRLTHLPSLHLRITLPEEYPESKPPKFELSAEPRWLPQSRLGELEAEGQRMWEELGRDLVVFAYIDFLQQSAENAFGFGEEGTILEIPQDQKISLLDFDIVAKQAAFAKETYECGVCLDPKKGSVCHRMVDCGHVFCVQCLQDFYNNAIKEGDLVSVRCLAPNCAKDRAERKKSSSGKSRKPKVQLSPSELLQIPLEHEVVSRYVKLKHKAQLEKDKNTVYCPRAWCKGAAKSKKHKKPEGFEEVESSDEDEDDDGQNKKNGVVAGADRLAVCEDCSYAFCSRCLQGWHGEFKICMPKREDAELTEEEKASLEYMKLHTTPCPTCAAPSQKTHGCNHMICFKCQSHFCYLCSAWLDPSNPYKHYNVETTGCYMRLWELEGGDGDDVGIGYVGGNQRARPVEEIPEEELVVFEVEEPEPEVQEAPVAEEPGDRRELEREGPLVLRINQARVAPQAAPAVPDAPPAPRNNRVAPRGNRQNRGNANANANANNRAPRAGAHAARPRAVDPQQVPRQVAPVAPAEELVQDPEGQNAANQAWVQRFVQMALNDEEDQMEWDSDDEDNHAAWEIPVR